MVELIQFSAGLFFIIIAGLAFGSFSTMAVYRLPRNIPWINRKPYCISCNHDLTLKDYFPVTSWFQQKQTCRYCGTTFKNQNIYSFTEIATVCLLFICYLQFQFSDDLVMVGAFAVALVVLIAIEITHNTLHPRVLLTMTLFGLVYRTWIDGSIYGPLDGFLIGAIAGIAIRHLCSFFSKELEATRYHYLPGTQRAANLNAPGMEQVMLLAILGIWLPIEGFVLCVVLGFIAIILCKLLHLRILKSLLFGGLAFYYLTFSPPIFHIYG